MMDAVLFIYRSLALVAPLGVLVCFIAMFLAVILWMRSVPSTLRVHAPLVDGAVGFRSRKKAAWRPAQNVEWVSRA